MTPRYLAGYAKESGLKQSLIMRDGTLLRALMMLLVRTKEKIKLNERIVSLVKFFPKRNT